MAAVDLVDVRKAYGEHEVIHGVSIGISDGEFVALVGPSGCGKSTLLRMIAGLEPITKGEIKIESKVVNDLEPKDRDIAMVFQSYALYPHMTVAENMSYSLRLRRTAKERIAAAISGAASKLGLDALMARRPRALSGGQRQRVAMGRAIVRAPKAFLFDEPLSNLDARLREQMRGEIKKLHQSLGATSIYVTHDQIEAMTLADRIVAMNPTAVFAAGDNVYNSGTLAQYLERYEPNWGRFKALTFPVPGNHEYWTAGAAGYFDYFNGVGVETGPAGTRGQGYYSYDVGDWHIVALNSALPMGAGTPQEQWLQADLASSAKTCTLAYWHVPRFSSGHHGSDMRSAAIWRVL